MTQGEETITLTRHQLAAYVASRSLLARMFGQHTGFDDTRNYYEVLGYTDAITIEKYQQRYHRQDIAGRIVDLPPRDSWKRPPQVSENGNTETPFGKAWQDLATLERLRVWAKLQRADRLSGIGRFGVLLLGYKDGGKLEQAIQKRMTTLDDLLYLRPFAEDRVSILTFDEDTQSMRYGLPKIYELELRSDDEESTKVHWSRVVHIAEGKESDEVYGRPRLELVFNRLDDLMKLVGGSAEATWLGMRPGTLLSRKEDYRNPMSDTAIQEEVEDYANDPLRIMYLQGVEAQQLGPSEVVNISDPFEVILSLISAASGIPQRVLVGSAQGEVAAAEWDQKQWAGEVAGRQKNHVEPEILRPFIDRQIEVGILPAPALGKYHVGEVDRFGKWRWPSILEQTDIERAETSERQAQAVAMLSDRSKAYILSEGERREMVDHPRDWPKGEERPEDPEDTETVPEAEDTLPGDDVDLDEMSAHASHAPVTVSHRCPFPSCGHWEAESYEGHSGLLRCAKCKRTFDPELE